MAKFSSERVGKQYLELNSCGIERLWDADYFCLREKGRVDFHILYIAQGCCYAELKGKEITLKEGSMILYLPGEKQKYRFKAVDKPISCYLHFTGSGCMEILKECDFLKTQVIHPGKRHIFYPLFSKLSDEKYCKKPLYEKMMNAYLMEFFVELSRIMRAQSMLNRKSQDIERVCAEMRKNYTEQKEVSYYADMCFLSTGRFHRVFKLYTGMTPCEYINDIRISRAKELLVNTNMTMSEIAERTGFSDQNYFSRVFKKYTGISPRQYLEQYIHQI